MGRINICIYIYIYIYPMAILSVNGENDGRETCIQGHRTWEYS
jgi:hypothetical protein